MTDNLSVPSLRLAKVLKQKKDELKSYSRLAQEIAVANRGEPILRVDRRKLKKLAEDKKDVSLSFNELAALDTYLTPFGEGLADRPLFDKPSLLMSLVEKGEVTFLLGSYPRTEDQRNDLSRWDVRSMAHLLRNVEQFKPGIHLNIKDVLFGGQKRLPSANPETCETDLRDDGPSVCCIGSPRTCLPSELMLATMFGIKPFKPNTNSNLPFRFIWSPGAPKHYPSSFAFNAEGIRDSHPKLSSEILNNNAWALEIKGDIYDVRRKNRKIWKNYGVVTVQRRVSGQIWMVVAGLSGPATYASALAITKEMTGVLPEQNTGCPPVLCSVVEATIRRKSRTAGDIREVISQKVLIRPFLLEPKT